MVSVGDSPALPRRTTSDKSAAMTSSPADIILNGESEEAPPGGPILLIEPFYGGSHRQLIDLLYAKVDGCTKVTMPAKKWHWRARTGALYLAQQVPHTSSYKVLFCSSVLNLAELTALRPDLACLHKVLYFHENQLVYPVRKQQDRDFQYGYNQVLSCMVADVIVFNSKYNMTSFLDSIGPFMKLMPDHRPRHLATLIRPKCRVLNFPIRFPTRTDLSTAAALPNAVLQDRPSTVGTKSADSGTDLQQTNGYNNNSGSFQESPRPKGRGKKPIAGGTDEEESDIKSVEPVVSGSSSTRGEEDITARSTSDRETTNIGGAEVVMRRPTCLRGDATASCGSETKAERRSMCFSPGEPLGLQLMSPIDADMDILMSRGSRMDFSGTGSLNMRRSETEPLSLMGENLPCALDLSPTSTCKSLNDVVAAATESQVTVEVKVKGKSDGLRSEVEDEESKDNKPIHIVWPHRWEHDKDPDTFFRVLYQLQDEGCRFKVSVLGETFTDTPAIFSEAKERLSQHISTWGYIASKSDYCRVLESADIVVSTAKHEFFGVAMLEAVHLGCYPLCPNDLVYPEIFPRECLYNTTNQLAKTLRQFCKRPLLVRNRATQFNVDRYSWASLEADYKSLLTAPSINNK